jgi:hypothetical protein
MCENGEINRVTDSFVEEFYGRIDEEGKELIFKFVLVFARFEFALKKSGFTNKGSDNNKHESIVNFFCKRVMKCKKTANKTEENSAFPNWDSFVKSIRTQFNSERTPELKNAVDCLIQEPPYILTINNGQLAPIHRRIKPHTPKINKLCFHIRDIRNNLFHGAKLDQICGDAIARNYKLINSVITILEEWLNLNEEVESNFSNFNND